ncbi:hypothetical protein Dda_4871 [Drechslerella dactyloides]|uniref:Uncharacterized protein n=1 Tax=Drechslerella dactyloides TaxID=74499 RepID=A0AAD6IZ60_DREDA|nr:hypothetical protein Dda_4871 [Drechslerella dactyloides]
MLLFNLISWEDNELNAGVAKDSKELAEASKRDSSSVKIIAILITLSLSATFVVTYCVFAIPLSLVVIGIMGSYALIQTWRTKLAARGAWKQADL